MTHAEILAADSQAAAFAAMRGIHSETEWLTAFESFSDDLIAAFLRQHWRERVINRSHGFTLYSHPAGRSRAVLFDYPDSLPTVLVMSEQDLIVAKSNMMAQDNQILFTSRFCS